MFIIDFDDTLFDTRPGFSDARVKALMKLGISEQLYNESYKKARADVSGKVVYGNKRHAQVLAEYGFSEKKVYHALEKTCEPARLKKFLFKDAINFLEKLRKLKQPMILLSLGEEEFQYQKIKALDLAKYFDRFFMVNTSKRAATAEIVENVSDKTIWFINDKISETKNICGIYSILKPVLKRCARETDEDYAKCNIPNFKTLTEIYDYITKQSK